MSNKKSPQEDMTLQEFWSLVYVLRDAITANDGQFVRYWFACSRPDTPLAGVCGSYATSTEAATSYPRCSKHGPMQWIGTEFVLCGNKVRSE
ncbi:MAG: hypothetical protein PVI21_04970 [Candidatus Woesebacteria bacterium]|jgi:hypothetical protein